MHSELSVPLGNAEIWLDRHVHHLASHDLHPVSREAGRAVFETAYGTVRLAARGDGLKVRIDSADRGDLTVLQGSISETLIEADPALAEQIVWAGTSPKSGNPKNLRELTVQRVRPVSDWLLRMTLSGDALGPYDERGLHVRLMIPASPASGRDIVWPTVENTGAVRFPTGEDELVTRVYTIRSIDIAAGKVEIDIVRHAGGIFSDWSETAKPGDRVGMMGPGGGYFPADGWLTIGGDDTAVPAILRILEARRDTVCGGHAIIGLREHQTPLEIDLPQGFSLDWVLRDDLPAAMKAATAERGADQIVWFAGEAGQAREMREHFKSVLGVPADRRSSAVYWRLDEADHSH